MFQFPPPRRGRRAAQTWLHVRRSCFNSRPRAGGVRRSCVPSHSRPEFQFPPPRRGRPWAWWAASRSVPGFNSRPRAGGVGGREGEAGGGRGFNSRPRAGGVRRFQRSHRCCIFRFNSRPRAGGVGQLEVETREGERFNSRPRAGGVTFGYRVRRSRRRFNSRPRAGGVNGSTLSLDDHVKFQFPPPRRGRLR